MPVDGGACASRQRFFGKSRTTVQLLVGSQLGGYLPFATYRTINADITLHISRLPATAWIGLDGIHRVSVDAVGQTTANMFDETGLVGQMQSSVHVDRWGGPGNG